MSWFNADGLLIKFGREKGTVTKAGNFASPADGTQTVLQFDVDLTALGLNPAIVSDVINFPKNTRIEKVEVRTKVAAVSGDSATFNVGLQRRDRSTEVDYDGILEDLPVSEMNAIGEVHEYTVPAAGGAGVLVGVNAGASAYPAYVTVDRDTGTFSAGFVTIKLFLVSAS